jgi:6-pyruvoyltetrahydropterin/6-carboxytetrahydropterin synthase
MTKQLTLNRVYWFSAAHRLHAPGLTENDNKSVYDKCNNPMGHGHDYKLEVALKGKPDTETGMLISLDRFDAIVRSVLDTMDHRHLDKEVAYFKNHTSTGENIVAYIWQKLASRFPDTMLFHLKLWETNNNYFEYVKRGMHNE